MAENSAAAGGGAAVPNSWLVVSLMSGAQSAWPRIVGQSKFAASMRDFQLRPPSDLALPFRVSSEPAGYFFGHRQTGPESVDICIALDLGDCQE